MASVIFLGLCLALMVEANWFDNQPIHKHPLTYIITNVDYVIVYNDNHFIIFY